VRIVQCAEVIRNARHLCLGLPDADARSQSGKQAAALVLTVAEPPIIRMDEWLEAEGKPEIRHGDTGPHEVVRRIADHGHHDAIEMDGPPHYGGSPANRFCQ
jgi:hypothetical protein